MVSKNCLAHLRWLVQSSENCSLASRVTQRIPYRPSRSMATVAEPSEAQLQEPAKMFTPPAAPENHTALPDMNTHVTTTIYKFPTMEPLRFEYYPHSHLYLPLRKDILHRAIVYEGDKTRKGLASSKHRTEVAGSHRKMRPQKGTGRARVGDRQSPIFRGGGKTFGPKPRDFSTDLPKKVYDLAWRIALSYRYRRGQLIVVDKIRTPKFEDELSLEEEIVQDGFNIPLAAQRWYMRQIFDSNGWGRNDKRSVFIPYRRFEGNEGLFAGIENMPKHAKIRAADEVDCKNLLEFGRLVIEKKALDEIIENHQYDLQPPPGTKPIVPPALNMAADIDVASQQQ